MSENVHDASQLEQIGQRLKKTREARGLEQSQIAAQLRLSVHHVQALEEGSEQPFGAQIYLRGYLANYARQVGLNPDKLLAGLDDSVSQPPLQVATAVPPSHRLAEGVARWSTYLVGTVVVVLPILWWASEGSLDALLGTQNVEPGTAGVQTESLMPDASRPLANAGTPGRAAEQPMLASMTPVRSFPEAVMGPPEPASSKGSEATANGPAAPIVAPPLTPVPQTPPQLTLELAADSWVEVRDARGRRLEYDLLRAGTIHHYQGESPFRVLLGNAGGVTVRYNKAPFDFSPHVQGNLARFAVGDQNEQG